MATRSKRLTKEQNFCVHYDGVKTNGSTVQRNKGGRKALNDISNSKNVIPIGEDLGVSEKAQIPVVGKAQISGKKTQVSGRKASGDLTNSVKQQGLKRKGLEKKSIAIATVQRNKGGLRGRKAPNDISNSKNVIPIGEDLGVSEKAQIPVVGKAQISGKKTQVSGRKASGDLTNSVKQQGLKKKGLEKKSIAIAEDEDEDDYEYERFHDHGKCMKIMEDALGLHVHSEISGSDEDVSYCQSVYSCNTSPKIMEDALGLHVHSEISGSDEEGKLADTKHSEIMDGDVMTFYEIEKSSSPTIEDPYSYSIDDLDYISDLYIDDLDYIPDLSLRSPTP